MTTPDTGDDDDGSVAVWQVVTITGNDNTVILPPIDRWADGNPMRTVTRVVVEGDGNRILRSRPQE